MGFEVVRTIAPADLGVPSVPTFRLTCRAVGCHWADATQGREFMTLAGANMQAEYHVRDKGHTVDVERLAPSSVGHDATAAGAA